MRLQAPDGRCSDFTIAIELSPTVDQSPQLLATLRALNMMRNEAERWMFDNRDDLPSDCSEASNEVLADIMRVVTVPDLPTPLIENTLRYIINRIRHHNEASRHYGNESPVFLPGSVLTWDTNCNAVHLPVLGASMWVIAKLPPVPPKEHEGAFLCLESGKWGMRCQIGITLNQNMVTPEPVANRWLANRGKA
jgi:hypothetical protein